MKANAPKDSTCADAAVRFLPPLIGCALLVAGLLSISAPVAVAQAEPMPDSPNGRTFVRGYVECGDRPMDGVQVRLLTLEGKEIGRTQKIGRTGAFLVSAGSLPAVFRAQAVGDALDNVVLEVEVSDFNPATDMLYINPATTLVEMLVRDEPGLGEQKAENEVDHYLNSPAPGGIAKRRPPSIFDASISDVMKAGGGKLGTYLGRIEKQLGADPNSLFVAPTTAVMARSAAGDIAVATVADTTTEGVKSMASELFKRAFDAGDYIAGPAGALVAPVFGWFLDSIGLSVEEPDPTALKLDEIKAKIEDLSLKLDEIKLSLQTLGYDLNSLRADTLDFQYYNRIKGMGDNLETNLKAYAGLEDWMTDGIKDGSLNAKQVIYYGKQLKLYGEAVQKDWFANTLKNQMVDKTLGAEPLMNLASRCVREKSFFWSQDSSRQIQARFDYLITLQLIQASVMVDLGHILAATPQYFKNLEERYNKNFAEEVAMLKPQLPDFTLIDIKNGLMWYTGNTAFIGKGPLEVYFRNMTINDFYDVNSYNEPTVDFGAWNTPANPNEWRLPSRGDFEFLAGKAKDSGPTFPSWLVDKSGKYMVWNFQAVLDNCANDAMKQNYQRLAAMSKEEKAAKKSYDDDLQKVRRQIWKDAEGRAKKANVKSEQVLDGSGEIRELLVDYWNTTPEFPWWTGSTKAELDDNKNAGGMVRVFQGSNDNYYWQNNPPGSTLSVTRFNPQDASFTKDTLGWAKDDGFFAHGDKYSGYAKSPIETVLVYRKKGDQGYQGYYTIENLAWVNGKKTNVNGSTRLFNVQYRGADTPNWIPGTVIAVRNVTRDEMAKYFVLDGN